MSIEPLSRSEFTTALRKGQGRALRHIVHYGISDYKDLVLEACLHNQNYDSQIDSSRAPWLFSMFHKTPFYDEFQEAILNGLEFPSSWDLVQMCNLLREMAVAGDALARQRLKEIVFDIATKDSEDEHIITETFIDIQSTDEFVELARIYGNRLLEDQTAFPFDGLIPEEKKQEFKELLYRYAQKDLSIRNYWQYLDKRGCFDDTPKIIDRDAAKRDWHNRARQLFSLDQILEDARNKKGDFPGHYVTFGKHATKEELDAVYASLISENDPGVLMRLLWVFRRAELPRLEDVLFQWANGVDEGIRSSVIAALTQIKDEKVHELAKEKVTKQDLLGPDNDAIGLFHKNYEESDAELISSALSSLMVNDEDAHALGYDLIALSESYEHSNLSNAMKWVYEYTPCTFCRYRALMQLKKFGALDAKIAEECQFDANEDIRAFVNTDWHLSRN